MAYVLTGSVLRSYAHYALGITSVIAEDFDQAVRAAEMAVELGPAFAF